MYTGRTLRVLRRGAASALALLLAACGGTPPADVHIGFRNPTVTIAGTSRFDAGRFAGNWVTRRCLGQCDAEVSYQLRDGLLLRRTAAGQVAYSLSAPGVLRNEDGPGTLVVMWVDEGFRTAAVGEADGRWAAVIDRTGRGGTDRIAAAVEILDFNGWDVAKLERVGG